MHQIQLKISQDRLALIIRALERDIDINRASQDAREQASVLAWLRYRYSRAVNAGPGDLAS